MKVLLVNPTPSLDMETWPPLGLGYIGASLEQDGHEIRLLDRSALTRKIKSLELLDRESEAALRSFQPDLVGITATTPLIPDAFHIAEMTKRLWPRVPVVLGGVHASILPRETLQASPDIDIVVKGEGELTMKELCSGRGLESVAGTYYRKNGDIVAAPDRNVIPNLDELPLPARHLFDLKDFWQSHNNYWLFTGVEARTTHLHNSRGCPYRCTFCAGSCVFGAKVRPVSTPRFMEEVESILANYPVEGLLFADDYFTFNRKRVLEICRLFIERRISRRIFWGAGGRVHPPLDEEVLRLMKKAGCVQVIYGFESGSQRILDRMDKRTTVRQNYDAAMLTRKVGLRFMASVILGTPGETREDFMATIDLLKATHPDAVAFNRFVPLPGSKMFDDLRRQKLVESDWSKYHTGLSNNKDVNFTAMTDQEFNDLFSHYLTFFGYQTWRGSFLSYSLARNPIRTIQRIVPQAEEKTPRTFRTLVRRVASDPDVIARNIASLSRSVLGRQGPGHEVGPSRKSLKNKERL